MTVREAVVKQGQIVLDPPLPFPDGTAVEVQIATVNGVPAAPQVEEEPAEDDDPLQWLIDHAVDTGIPDLADEHDHYIYGTPKRKPSP